MASGLQVEDGNFTRIINPVIEHLLPIPFNGCEIVVAFYIIRKTWGYQKTKDSISLSQFEHDLKRSRPTIVKALKNLERINVLVKTALPRKTNTYKINKYFDTWGVVKTAKLVKCKRGGSKASFTKTSKAGFTYKRKKEIYTKEILATNVAGKSLEVSEKEDEHKFITSFVEKWGSVFSDPHGVASWYGNTTQRAAILSLRKRLGDEKLNSLLDKLPGFISQPYFPKITTPHELNRDLQKLIAAIKQEKGKSITEHKKTKDLVIKIR